MMAEKGVVEELLDQCAKSIAYKEKETGRVERDELMEARLAIIFLHRAVRAINDRLGVVVVESGPRRTTCRLDLLPDYHREALAEIGRLEWRIKEALFILKGTGSLGDSVTFDGVFKSINTAISHLEGAHDVH